MGTSRKNGSVRLLEQKIQDYLLFYMKVSRIFVHDGRYIHSNAGTGTNPDYYLRSKFPLLRFFISCQWLDSSMRLHMQAHPTKEFSKKYLGMSMGKFEAYYVWQSGSQ